ncbi:Sun protein [Desulfosarcina cetonica]|nr:Sun protein [Desulfosarcina cetonica]
MTTNRRPFLDRRSAPKRRPPVDARGAALFILDQLELSRVTLDDLLEGQERQLAKLDSRDRALFNQLVYGVLRWRLRLDSVIMAYADRPIGKIAPTVRNILRLAFFQTHFMDRIPPSAAVNTAVELARAHGAAKATGFINALLRTALREPERFQLPHPTDASPNHLSLATSTPFWMMERWITRLGFDEARRLGEAINQIPPISVRCNRLIIAPPDLFTALTEAAESVTPINALPGAFNLIGPRVPLSKMPAFVAGYFAVQDAAAQLVSLMLAPQPGETVLDACAGLGGKTGHLAQLMENRGRIVALDHVPGKLTRLMQEAKRLGVSIIETRRANLNQPVSGLETRFDRVLVDAPCSGLGVLRRNPDAKWATREKDIPRLADRQVRFLDHLAPLLKTGGTLVYSVCSMEPEENEGVIQRFLKSHTNFAIDRQTAATELQPFLDDGGFLRTYPHRHQMDGFFAARLTRTR